MTDSTNTSYIRYLAQLLTNAGVPKSKIPTMVSISLAEDPTHTSTETHSNDNGSSDTGFWQINSSHGVANLTNPQANANAAKNILSSQGLTAWTQYRNGSYKKFMSSVNAALGGSSSASASDTTTSTSSNANDAVEPGAAAESKGVSFPLLVMAALIVSGSIWAVDQYDSRAAWLLAFLILLGIAFRYQSFGSELLSLLGQTANQVTDNAANVPSGQLGTGQIGPLPTTMVIQAGGVP